MSAPTGDTDTPPSEAEAIERVQSLVDEGRTLQALAYTEGQTEYAHIYLAAVTGEYKGNQMLWIRYVWLSKPGAYENDTWGDNGISMRMVDGMAGAFRKLAARAATGVENGIEDDPLYVTAE